jgi:hypothetical protein
MSLRGRYEGAEHRMAVLPLATQLGRLSSNGNLNLDTSIDCDMLERVPIHTPRAHCAAGKPTVDNDRLDDLGRGVEVNQALVNAELVGVPGLAAFTARGLAGGDLEVLGGQADGALDREALVAGALNQLGADLLEGGNISAREGDADTVALLHEAVSGGQRRRRSVGKRTG